MSDEKKEEKFTLRWNGTGFDPISTKENGIYLELDDEKQEWIFSYSSGTPLIARRTALRRANEIAKVGIVNPATGGRVGVSCKCIEAVDPYNELPDVLKSDQHKYNAKK